MVDPSKKSLDRKDAALCVPSAMDDAMNDSNAHSDPDGKAAALPQDIVSALKKDDACALLEWLDTSDADIEAVAAGSSKTALLLAVHEAAARSGRRPLATRSGVSGRAVRQSAPTGKNHLRPCPTMR